MKAIDKEQVYDEQISPLLRQIIKICTEHKIAVIATFAIPTEDNPQLACTSALLSDDYQPTRYQRDMLEIVQRDLARHALRAE